MRAMTSGSSWRLFVNAVPPGAARINNLIKTSVEKLPAYPHLHREGREPGTREAVVHPNYIYIYAVHEDSIHILRVLHSRQHYP